MPSGSYRGSSREDSIGSSFFGDTDSRIGTAPSEEGMAIKHILSESSDWHERDLVRNFEGLGIHNGHDDVLSVDENKGVPQQETQPYPNTFEGSHIESLAQHISPPPNALLSSLPGERITLRKKRSTDNKQQIAARASGESGDDEDDELGAPARARSPRNRPRGTSKLGTEMLRTNSRGSVVSVEGIVDLPLPATSAAAVVPDLEQTVIEEPASSSKDAISPSEPPITVTPPTEAVDTPNLETSGKVVEDLDATPRPTLSHVVGKGDVTPDTDPTPRPSVSQSRGSQLQSIAEPNELLLKDDTPSKSSTKTV